MEEPAVKTKVEAKRENSMTQPEYAGTGCTVPAGR